MNDLLSCNFTGTPQQQMSAMTYAKRASLAAVTGVILDDDSDDDGNAANTVKSADNKSRINDRKEKKPTVKQTMAAIHEADDARLLKIVDWIEANANTSKPALLKAVEERRDEIAKADSFKSWEQ